MHIRRALRPLREARFDLPRTTAITSAAAELHALFPRRKAMSTRPQSTQKREGKKQQPGLDTKHLKGRCRFPLGRRGRNPRSGLGWDSVLRKQSFSIEGADVLD